MSEFPKRPPRHALRLLAQVATSLVLIFAAFLIPPSSAAERTVTILNHSVRPKVLADSDTAGVELGVAFTAIRAGTITAIQFYRSSAQHAAYAGSIWSDDGDKLATAKIPARDSAGWQTAYLRRPLRVSAGRSLVASYYAPHGGYAATNRAFTRPAKRNGFSLPASAGVYQYGPRSDFPTHSWQASNYFVDVLFRPGSNPPQPTPSVPPARDAYPTLDTAGLPTNWKPARQISGDLHIRTAGAVVQDVRITGTIFVEAANVTLRRIEGVGARVNNYPGSTCESGLVIEDSTFRRGDLGSGDVGSPVIGAGGYTARNVVIDGAPEGMRVGGKPDCGPVDIEDSYIRVMPPDVCGDWHGDGIQGYGGAKLRVRNSVIDFHELGCGGTAPFFYPADQGNTSVDIDRLIVSGGGYPFRLGTPGSVTHLGVVDQSWGYGPLDVPSCSSLSKWQAEIVRLNSDGQPVPVRSLSC